MMQVYPSLTAEEFFEVCRALEKRCEDKLSSTDVEDGTGRSGGLRWIGVEWTGEELKIKAVRNSGTGDVMKDRDSETKAEAEAETEAEVEAEEVGEIEEEVDDDSLQRSVKPDDSLVKVDFSITLSPTYSVPVLWFTSDKLKKVEDVHRVLVATHLRESVRDVGVMGGISRAYHPVSDLPAFFIHPCNTHEALLSVHDGPDLTPEDYLVLWLGLIGASVGLHVPGKILM